MKLVNPTDRQLDACFAETVCGRTHVPELTDPDNPHYGYREHWDKSGEELWFRDNQTLGIQMPKFSSSFDAVLPWLKGAMWSAQEHVPGFGYTVEIRHESILEVSGKSSCEGLSLPRAACIALLRAHGVEIEFT